VDRWYVTATGNTATAQQITAPGMAPMPQYLQINGAAGVTAVTIGQRIEAANCSDMVNRQLRISFWANNATGSNMTIAVVTSYASASDNFTTQTQLNSTNATLTPGWSKYTITAFSASNASVINGISLEFRTPALGAGASLSFTGVQLEVGGQASAFELRPLGMEMAMCYRYFQRFSSNSTYTTLSFGQGLATTTTNGAIFVKFKTAMRSTPTFASSVSASNIRLANASNFAVTGFGTTSFGTNTATVNATSTGLTAGAGLSLCAAASAAAYVEFSSEL
jgi:hypothetical protein